MKKLLIVSMLLMGMAIPGFSQTAKIIAVVNKASWCTVCKENGPRFEKEIMPMVMGDKNVSMVVNDLSDDKTKASSQAMLQKAGIPSFAKEHNATGALYFVDAKSKKVISEVSLAKSNEEIKTAYMSAVAKK
ncbi:hypothetical protein [Pedobacter sp.]|uniref:hypothetical protein n=1 Tax=Pedobacter sp. TaxID=1411316 RepID=UPI003C3AF4DB